MKLLTFYCKFLSKEEGVAEEALLPQVRLFTAHLRFHFMRNHQVVLLGSTRKLLKTTKTGELQYLRSQ